MKITPSKRELWSLVILVFGVMCAGSAWAQYQPVTVQVSVSEDESRLEVVTPSQCGAAGGRGCVEAKPNTKIRIHLVLVGNTRCGSGGRWALSEVFLGGEGSATKPSTWGGLSLAARDFDVNAASGKVVLEVGSNENQVKFIDRNSAAYDVWYTVTATCHGRTIEVDPRIRNGGTG